MSKARDIADVGAIVGRKNLIINGGFDVWQRGTSFSHTAITDSYTADRWLHANNGTTSTTIQAWDIINSEKITTVVAESVGYTYNALIQRLEGLRKLQGKTLTLSFWVKSNVGTESQYIEFRDSIGNVVTEKTFSVTYTGSWQYVTHTFDVPTDVLYDNDLSWFNVSFYGGDSLALANVQLELGSQATDFEYRSYGEELSLCLRYYQKGRSSVYDSADNATRYGSDNFVVPMRATPTMVRTGPYISSVSETGTIFLAADVYSFYFANNGSIAAGGTFTADAEL